VLQVLLDQMIDNNIAKALRQRHIDVLRTCEIGLNRANDAEVLNKAKEEKRVLITLDEHFGDWAILPLEKHSGVIRIKVHPTTSRNILDILLPFIEKNINKSFNNYLVILSKKGTRWINTSMEDN